MGLTWPRNQRLNTAFFTSIAIHMLIALMIPALVVLNGEDTSIQTITFSRLIPIRITTPHPVEHPLAATAPVQAPFVRIVKNKPATSQKASTLQRPATNKGAVSHAPVQSTTTQTGSVAAQPGNAAAAATPQAQSSTDVAHREPGGYMPLGAEQPVPVLDPAVHDQLEQMGIHVTLVVTVGDDGRTKNVVFKPDLDAATEARIRALLASATWDPATCGGGIACEGSATITL